MNLEIRGSACHARAVSEPPPNPKTSTSPDQGGEGAQDEARPQIQGTIEIVTYHDEDSLYTVMRLAPEGNIRIPGTASLFGNDRISVVGRIPDPIEGQRLRLCGTWSEHKSHGTQFEFEEFEQLPPLDREGLVRYLSSKTFTGIGETIAKRIVEELGAKTLEVIRDQPESLKRIRGLRAEVAQELVDTLRTQFDSHQAQAFLRGLGLGPLQSLATVRALGGECEGLIRANPYRLAKVSGLGFASADRIARQLGIEDGDPRRLAAAALHALDESTSDGHSLLPRAALVARTAELLKQAADVEFRQTLNQALQELHDVEDLAICPALDPNRPGSRPGDPSADADLEQNSDGPSDTQLESIEADLAHVDGAEELTSVHAADSDRIYLPWLLQSEQRLAQNIAALIATGTRRALADAASLKVAEASVGFELHPSQREAILSLLATPIGLLTGGPGVGKTTILKLMTMLAEDAGARIVLASPTGRAAKRLAEATGRDASTLHRLLGFRPGAGFERNDKNPLEADLVIVDEISMLDVTLAHHLLKAIEPPTRLIMVGDPDQLPSVGPGNVLTDLINSKCVPVLRLDHIYRQSEGSRIVSNAHRVLQSQVPQYPERGDTSGSFYFFPCEGTEATAKRLVEVVTKRIPETFGFEWTRDVQVLAPMYRGDCGVDALNFALREAQGFGGKELTRGNRTWRVGDRVIQTRNDYDREVFNGDMGRIVTITNDGIVTVRYPEREVVYEGSGVQDLMPAFAITVHRSQGGEFPVVVMPMVTQHAIMLQRNLFYTAITRAKKLVVLVGSTRAIRMAVENADHSHRESALAERITQLVL
ncbi:MAG: exodeoxyribonuclease V alpha subunit [Planctomycetota bacterium]